MSIITELAKEHAVGGDEDIIILAPPNGTAIVASRLSAQWSELPAGVHAKMFAVAGEIAMLGYEVLQAHGTNIIGSDDGHAHYLIISRREDDGLNLKWEGKRSSPKDLQDVAKKISDETWVIGKRDVTDRTNPTHTEPKAEPLTPAEAQPEKKEPAKSRDFDRPNMRPPGSTGEHDLASVAHDIQHSVRKGPIEEKDYRVKNLTRRR